MEWEEFFSVTITGMLFTLGALFYRLYPPKRINWWYGYRTRRSMSNQSIWDYANRIGARMLLYIGLTNVFCSLVFYFLLSFSKAMIASMFLMLISIGIGIFWCETLLNRHFDKNGNLKK